MQSIQRNGVEFDMCPSCRGVWLDRGELEKLIEAARAPTAQESPAPPQPRAHDDSVRREYGEQGERGERGHYDPRRRKRGFDLFDIFD